MVGNRFCGGGMTSASERRIVLRSQIRILRQGSAS